MILKRIISAYRSEPSELPFFIFVSLILTGIAAWTIYTTPGLHAPARCALFIALMFVHIGLYWFSILFVENGRRILVYLFLQGILAFIITMVGQSAGPAMGLYLGLVGIAVGLLQLTRRAALVIGYYLLLSVVSFGVLAGWSQIMWWLAPTLPTILFVIIYVTLYNRQNEARSRAQALAAELEAANRQLSEYANRVGELTLVNERQRMARELHDTLSQGLAGLILQLEAADAHLASGRSERARSIVQQTMLHARATLADARRAIDDLRAKSPLDLLGVARQEVRRFTEATGIPCQLEADLAVPVPDALDEPAGRSIAEGLTNIARHAQASQALVRLVSGSEGLEITIQDNGHGFDPQAAEGQVGHYGLLGLRERARLAGGNMHVDSQPAAGTVVRLRFPIPAEKPGAAGNEPAQGAR